MVKQYSDPLTKEFYVAADVSNHHLGTMSVTTALDAVEISGLKVNEHTLFLLETDALCEKGNWEGTRLPQRLWKAGETVFLPAKTELHASAANPYSETSIRISDHWFRECAVGEVDYGDIDFRYRGFSDQTTSAIANAIKGLTWMRGRHWPMLTESLTMALAASTVHALCGKEAELGCRKNGLDRERQKRVLDYMQTNIHRQITLAELAGVAALSLFHFSRSFRLSFGISPLRYVLGQRVKNAKLMMQKTNEPLNDIADACGFASQSHFTTAFRVATSATPRDWRKSRA